MKSNRDIPAGSLALAKGYESLRKQLHEPQYADRLDRPLTYWAAANDRRLPWALLERTLRAVISLPFEQVLATPSVGPKKVNSLLELLGRAAEDQSAMAVFGDNHLGDGQKIAAPLSKAAKFDAALVSEAMWSQWREAIARFGLENEPLGRLFPTLKLLPTVLWETPLSFYSRHTLAEMRKRKTHGTKRINLILETFYGVYATIGRGAPADYLGVRLVPKFAAAIEKRLLELLAAKSLPNEDDVRRSITVPLVQQLQNDAPPVVVRLAEERLGLKGTPQTVRQQARKVSVTRARVYQLLEECNRIMEVRWPQGRYLCDALSKRFREAAMLADVEWTLFRGTADLFFPSRLLRTNEEP